MRKGLGIGCIVLGLVCLLIAVGFVVYNDREAAQAGETAQTLLQTLQENLREVKESETLPETRQPEEIAEEIPGEDIPETMPQEMMTVPVGRYSSIGVLSIPVLELELPVLTDWSYEKLRSAPCHYYGSCYETDFVIAAHNYPSHFGRLSQLRPGDLVVFTDVSGIAHGYEVELLETLAPTATKEMITSGFDLSLYTCTPGGSNRVTVRCKAIQS